jgi:hypothetical protein
MAKANTLSKALDNKSKAKAAKHKASETNGNGNGDSPYNREARVMVGGHFEPGVQRQVRMIAAEEGVTIQALFAEALNLLFAKRGKPELAAVLPDGRKSVTA